MPLVFTEVSAYLLDWHLLITRSGTQYEDEPMDLMPASHNLARSFGVSASQVQLQKASFFAMDDDFEEDTDKRTGYS